MFINLKLLLLLLIGIFNIEAFRDNDLTAEIAAGKKECYFQPTEDGHTLEVEYQVGYYVQAFFE